MIATVGDAKELALAIESGENEIVVRGTITGSPMITLPPGVSLRGEGEASLVFGAKGVRLTSDNTVENLTIRTSASDVALFNDTSVENFGTITLRHLRTTGQIAILADDLTKEGRLIVDDVIVEDADLRGRVERPHGYNVDVMQGAFTVWNRQKAPDSVIRATLTGIGAGTEERPVRGSGVFISGNGDWEGSGFGGKVDVDTLTTKAVTTDGGIAPGTADLISGGVFIVYNVEINQVINEEPVVTHGQNDMALDNWGSVETWVAKDSVTTHGASGIGFVNFNDIQTLDVQGPIITTGVGARGFNVYDGKLEEAIFTSVATTGDGSVGIQISKPVSKITVRKDITTVGGEGLSLVRGAQVTLQAIALSVKEGGNVNEIHVGGDISTSGSNVVTVDIDETVGRFDVAGIVRATGARADALRVRRGCVDISTVDSFSLDGKTVVERDE